MNSNDVFRIIFKPSGKWVIMKGISANKEKQWVPNKAYIFKPRSNSKGVYLKCLCKNVTWESLWEFNSLKTERNTEGLFKPMTWSILQSKEQIRWKDCTVTNERKHELYGTYGL